MGKFLCECGHRFSDTAMPTPELFALVDSRSYMDDDPEELSAKIIDMPEIWECPECKGLSRFDNSAYRTAFYQRLLKEK